MLPALNTPQDADAGGWSSSDCDEPRKPDGNGLRHARKWVEDAYLGSWLPALCHTVIDPTLDVLLETLQHGVVASIATEHFVVRLFRTASNVGSHCSHSAAVTEGWPRHFEVSFTHKQRYNLRPHGA